MHNNRRAELSDIMDRLNQYKAKEQAGDMDTTDYLIRDSIRETARQIMKHYGVVTGKTTSKTNVDALKQA